MDEFEGNKTDKSFLYESTMPDIFIQAIERWDEPYDMRLYDGIESLGEVISKQFS